MVQFLNKGIEEVDDPRGIIVLDTNLQGLWTTEEMQYMEFMYPRLYKCYQHICRHAYNNTAGNAVVIEDNGQRFVLLFTKRTRHDKLEDQIKNFRSALNCITKQVSPNRDVYSGILGRDSKLFNSYLNILMDWTKEHGYNWNVCRMQRSSK